MDNTRKLFARLEKMGLVRLLIVTKEYPATPILAHQLIALKVYVAERWIVRSEHYNDNCWMLAWSEIWYINANKHKLNKLLGNLEIHAINDFLKVALHTC